MAKNVAGKFTQSIYTVASRAGCSPSTVSRVLNNSARVNPETRDSILAAMRELKFTPRKRVPQIGLLVTGLSGATMTSYISQMIRKMFLELSQYNLLVKYLDGDNPDLTLTDDFDAIVSLAYNDSVERLASKVKIPVVAINHPMRQACFCQIMSDHRQSARIAAEYLLMMGHRRIMLLVFSRRSWGCCERIEAFEETMRNCPGAEAHVGITREEPIDNILLRMRRNHCTGLINFSDDVLLRVPFLLTHVMKVRIPDELSVISEDLPGVFEYYSPPLTVVNQPVDKLICQAVKSLEALLRGEPISASTVVFDNELIIRDSVCRI